MIYKTAAELQSGALANLKNIDTKKLAAMASGQNPAALLNNIPAHLRGMLAGKVDLKKVSEMSFLKTENDCLNYALKNFSWTQSC
jgi:hypothetical protein